MDTVFSLQSLGPCQYNQHLYLRRAIMSYVHWQYQTGQGQIKPLTLEEFSKIDDLRPLLRVMSVEEKIHLLAVSTEVDG